MKALKEIKDSEKLKEKNANRKSRGGNKIKAIENQNASWASTYTNGRFRKKYQFLSTEKIVLENAEKQIEKSSKTFMSKIY